MVLGATPELRDLLYELKCEVTIIDAAAAMVQAMTGLKKHRSAPEKVVISDWIDNPRKADYFDVIVGDIILANIPRQKQPEFLRGLARMLKPGGHFISRLLLRINLNRFRLINFWPNAKSFYQNIAIRPWK